jgi:gamma-butyrobetaine dioxygenase
MTAFTIGMREHALDIKWRDGLEASFPFLWLIDNEPAAFHPQTEERIFDLSQAPEDLRPLSVEALTDAILVTWPARKEPSRIEADWLRAHRPGARRPDPADIPSLLWRGADDLKTVPRHSGAEIIASDDALLRWMKDAVRTGLTIVDGLAAGPEAGVAIAERAGFLRRTNFGTTFEVVSKPDPNNLAYTAQALPLHTDLANQEVPPGYQFLHCIANEAEGGGSIFCDGFAVAEDLRASDRQAFKILSETEIPFRFHDRDTDIRGRFAVIVRDRQGRMRELRFNAHLVDIVDLDGETLTAFYAAYARFMRMLRDPGHACRLRLSAGEMVVFDNRRVLHGRDAFNPATGFRFLNGCYVDRGEFLSRIRVLSRGR